MDVPVDQHYLTPLFEPRSIAVFAGNPDVAPEVPLAVTMLREFQAAGFAGEVRWLDTDTTGTLQELSQARADLALIALPHERIANALEIAGRIRSRTALVLSNGFPVGQTAELYAIAKRHGMHLLGPNSLGFQRPHDKLNAGVLGPLAAAGPLGLVSQSGALTTSILDWAAVNGVGFSAVVSLGPHTAVDLPEVLDYLANDHRTKSILVYMEGIRHARRFMSALRAAAYSKPVVLMKAGRQPAGSQAALTHSASIVGSDDVFDAALRRAGVVRVNAFTQLFSAAKCLASRFRPVGRRLAIVTNGGGPGVLAADWANAIDIEVAHLSPATRAALQPLLGVTASTEGVVDLGEDATPGQLKAAAQAALDDKQVDGLLVIHTPKPDGDPNAMVQALAAMAPKASKPMLGCWMGDARVREARMALSALNLPNFRTPEAAVDAFGSISSFYRNQQLLQQTPPPLSDGPKPDADGARLLIESVLAERRQVLTEMESKALLAAFHIPVTRTLLARTATEAMLIASQLGYPVALKIDSADIVHKSDVQGVALNVMNATGVRDTYEDLLATVKRLQPTARINGITIQPMSGKRAGREIYIGVTTDEAFGPVVAFGAGGTMIELIQDRAMELPPLNQFLARRLVERSRAATMLDAFRGAPAVNRAAIEQVLLRVSDMVCALPQLREMDINPLVVDADGVVAVDARIVVDQPLAIGHAQPKGPQAVPGVTPHLATGPFSHLAILPYPTDAEREWPLKGGGTYTVRPIQPDDAEMLQSFVRRLSPEARYFRFVSAMPEMPPSMLARYTLIDYDREMALVAVVKSAVVNTGAVNTAEPGNDAAAAGDATADGTPTGQAPEPTELIVGVSRYITNPDQVTCEFSLAVSDELKGQGIGTRLMQSIIDLARAKGLNELQGLVLTNNSAMLRLMRHLGFSVAAYPEDPDFRLVRLGL